MWGRVTVGANNDEDGRRHTVMSPAIARLTARAAKPGVFAEVAATDNTVHQSTVLAALVKEIDYRKQRLGTFNAAIEKMESRADERYQQQQEYDQRVEERDAKEKATGKKIPGRAPTPPIRRKDQINLTDEQSRIMPTSGGASSRPTMCRLLSRWIPI